MSATSAGFSRERKRLLEFDRPSPEGDMNKHTRKKYPHAVREITVYEDDKPKGQPMSLFNETVARASRLEIELDAANKRIKDLERALENSRKVNLLAIKKSLLPHDDTAEISIRRVERVFPKNGYTLPPQPVCSLTNDEVEQQMAHAFAPTDYESDTVEPPHTPWRDRVVAPLCALFRRTA